MKQVGEKPLDEAMKYLSPLLELSPKNAGSQTAGFEVYIRRSKFFLQIAHCPSQHKLTNTVSDKYLPALKCLQALEALDAQHPALKDQSSRLRSALSPMPEDVPEKAREVLQSEFLSKQ